MALRHFFLVLLVVFLWASNNIAIKWGLQDLPPLFIICMRFVVVAILLIPFTRVTRHQLRYLLPLAFTFGVGHFSLLFVGINHTEAGTASIMVQLGTPFAMLLAMIVLKEKLTMTQILGITLSLFGIAVLSGSPTLSDWRAIVLLLSSAMGWAVSNMIVKKSPPISPLTMTGWLSFLAIPMVAFASFLYESNQFNALSHSTWRGWFSILYSAIGSSIIAYSLWYVLLKKYNVNVIMPYSLFTPVLTMIMGILILHDSLDYFKVTGSLLVMMGTAIPMISFSHFLNFIRNHRQKYRHDT